MKTLRIFHRTAILFFLLMLLSISQNLLYAQSTDLEKIRAAIKAKGAKWHASENWVTRLSREEQKKLCGVDLSKTRLLKGVKLISLPVPQNLPDSLDWRKNGGNWVTPVKNQGFECGSCWDFSAVAQVESWWKIYNSNQDSMIDLSEQYLLSSGGGGSCGGGTVTSALTFISNNGIPPEWCMTYQATDTIPADSVYAGWKQYAVNIPGWGYISGPDASVENIKNALALHPVSATFTVYDDFNSYHSGVYEHLSGEYINGHAILIVGWNDADSAWICKNSWGQSWGENGYFRIKWGECGIGEYSPFIWDGSSSADGLVILNDTLSFEVKQGESQTQTLSIRNSGTSTVEFAAIKGSVPVVFHPDTFNAKDGKSWWCGDPDVGGYENHWLQYLDTPVIDLTVTSNPVLYFDAFWAVEDPADTDPPWDGWDGCNVWISTDGGKTFSVIEPLSPAYACHHLWSFGHPEQGWDLGENIAGWAGKSGGWVDVSFDLSQFKNYDKVVVRWAFASDKGFSTPDDSSMTGFFVDNIRIGDPDNFVFINNADVKDGMSARWFGSMPAPWIVIDNGVGRISSGNIFDIAVTVNTDELAPDDYTGYLDLSTNSGSENSFIIPVLLKVLPSGTKVEEEFEYIPEKFSLLQNYPNPFNSSTIITYDIQHGGKCSICIYDVKGREIRRLLDETVHQGRHKAVWDGKNENGMQVSSGVYICVLRELNRMYNIKMLYIR